MEWQNLNRTCTGGHLWDAMYSTKEEIDRLLMSSHAILIAYGTRTPNPQFPYPITRVLNELEKAKAPDLRAIYLGPWSAHSSLWMIRRGPEVPNERGSPNVQATS